MRPKPGIVVKQLLRRSAYEIDLSLEEMWMTHRVLIFQGWVRGTRCGTDTDGWRLTKEPHDPAIVTKWSDTTCPACHATRIRPCKRGHPVAKQRINSQGALVCRDCLNIASMKLHKRYREEKKHA